MFNKLDNLLGQRLGRWARSLASK
ncbi:MAG: hypothetical protein O4861_02845 [Trichodesmium sp. St16_bin4-tuft]|nr:hypothetical protein [Trichodesmium sp. St4_bin8_1]MDE5078462.1 hypothetical protein [Trichodesmium sp. St2_bin6]MDE5097327.1 hypothetical protein [Trichodesmium sp. St16_bin4-tuft]MDE5104501.1 hypothetical protein [Trichodesmium sp. St19_bin2]